jgi:hypothetical protein
VTFAEFLRGQVTDKLAIHRRPEPVVSEGNEARHIGIGIDERSLDCKIELGRVNITEAMNVCTFGSVEELPVLDLKYTVVVIGLCPRALSYSSTKRRIPLATICDELVEDSTTTSAPSDDGHLGWVATECTNMLLNPIQRETLVEKSSVGSTVLSDISTSEEANGTKSRKRLARYMIVIWIEADLY